VARRGVNVVPPNGTNVLPCRLQVARGLSADKFHFRFSTAWGLLSWELCAMDGPKYKEKVWPFSTAFIGRVVDDNLNLPTLWVKLTCMGPIFV